MLKLSKYELRKNRNTLLFLLGGLLILQLLFQLALSHGEDPEIGASVTVLFLYGLVCYFSVFLLAVINYYREINSRTSYLVFMTPVSPLCIILSKMLTVLILGLILAGALGLLALADLQQLSTYYGEYAPIWDQITTLLASVGIRTGEIWSNILYGIITFLLSFYATVTIIYLCITLTATLLQNSRFRLIVSIVFFLLATWGRSKLQDWIGTFFQPDFANDISLTDLLTQSWPYTLLNLAVLIVCVATTSQLLKKKLSL